MGVVDVDFDVVDVDRKKGGGRQEPCGTPVFIFLEIKRELLILIWKIFLDGNDLIMFMGWLVF